MKTTIKKLEEKLVQKLADFVLNLPIKSDSLNGHKTLGDFIRHVEAYHEAINLVNISVLEEFQQINTVLDVLVKISKSSTGPSTKLPSINKINKDGIN